MRQLPSLMHHIALHEARRLQLERQAELAILAGRINALCRKAGRILADVEIYALTDDPIAASQPTMAWFDGPRMQPRDGRGRFLSRSWLAAAEIYTAADAAWFRRPVTASEER